MNQVLLATFFSFLAAIIWFVIVYRMDRHEKEPISLILKVFFAGFGLSFIAGILNEITEVLFGETGSYVFVGLVEEGVKFLAVYWVAFRHKAFNAHIDGIVYAAAAALGFAFAENIQYNLMIMSYYKDEASTALIIRSFLPLLHVLLASIWGYGLGYYKCYISGKGKLIGLWLLAAVLHSAYDLAVGEIAFVMLITFVVLGVAFLFKMKHLNRISPKNTKYLMSCPYCAEKIKENSLYCNHCGKHIMVLVSDIQIFCKTCQSQVNGKWQFCMQCGTKI
jgi:RsiW-degrading membrane proteinase PrsW (M82 family)